MRVRITRLVLLKGASTGGKGWWLWSWPGFLDLDPVRLAGGCERVARWCGDVCMRAIRRRLDSRARGHAVVEPPFTSVGACGRQTWLDGLVADERFFVCLELFGRGGVALHGGAPLHVKILADAVFRRLIDYIDLTLEETPDWPVIRELQRRGIVVQLTQIVALCENAIAPSWDSGFLRSVVDVCPWVKLVSRQEVWHRFRVVRERPPVDHLEVELVILVKLSELVCVD